MDAQDKMTRALAGLRSVRNNVTDQFGYVDERIVREYHAALGHLRDLGFDTAEFEIPKGDIGPRLVGREASRRGTEGAPIYSKDRSVPRDLFMTKIDTALGYFEMAGSHQGKPKEPIGFSGPKKS